jgi:putative OPT family oligopeptide transporter
MILGAAICVVFTAANVAFGLKAGLTFASSIPATVISMAVLRAFRNSTIQENNIVQTVASAAGTLSSIIFVLPGLVMIGWWTGFPFWASFSVCALGGILGVMYSIPLRRALVTNSDLPYPEGVACAEVLKVGSSHEAGEEAAAEGKAGLLTVLVGAIVSAVYYIIVQTRIFASDLAGYFRAGPSATGFDLGMSMALLAVGHLVGLSVGVAMLVGLIISWGGAVPILTAMHGTAGTAAEAAQTVWRTEVRFIGAGAIGIAAIWTLIKLLGPVINGLRGAMAAQKVRAAGQGASLPRTEQDMPIGIVALVSVVSLLPIGWLLATFAGAGGLGAFTVPLIVGGLIYVVVMGFFVSAVCGYMAGLIGSSNSPLSGVGILAVIVAAGLLVVGIKTQAGPNAGQALTAFALFLTSVVFAIASIANNNLQDLKTGQLVDATPWKQQVALVFGVLIGAVVIPPVMDLLNHSYGFAGAPGADPANALPAPQAALISALAEGVLKGDLDWNLIGIGVLIGVAVIVVDAVLVRARSRITLPALAVGLGIYLPMAVTLMIVIGALVGWAYERWMDRRPFGEAGKRLGVLLASGLIVGESLMIVAVGAVVWATNNPNAMVLAGEGFAVPAVIIGGLVFLGAAWALYRWVIGLAKGAAIP